MYDRVLQRLSTMWISSFTVSLMIGVLILVAPYTYTQALTNLHALQCIDVLYPPTGNKPCGTEAPPHLIGLVSLRQGDQRTAEKYLRIASFLARHPIAIQELANLLGNSGKWEELLDILTVLPVDGRQFVHLAQLDMAADQASANQWLRISKMKYPDDSLSFARLLINAGRYSQAENLLIQVLKQQTNTDGLTLLGMSLFYQHKYEEAVQVFSKLYQQSGSSEVAYWYGRALRYNNQVQDSIQPLKRAVDSESEWKRAYYQLELASAYAVLGDCNNLLVTLQDVKERGPDIPEVLQWIQSLDDAHQRICVTPPTDINN